MKRMTSAEVKETIFNTMVYFDKLCRKHNLKYFLAFGTCLGAVRHKDFIPWDDDADVFMDRESYDKLLEIMNKEKSHYKLLSFKESDKYFYPYYKLVDTRTAIREKYLKKIPNLGVYLDIFPLDGMPEDDKESTKVIRKFESLHHRLILNNINIAIGTKRLAKKLDELSLKYPVADCKYAGCTVWLGRRKCFDKTYADELVELPFHGYNFYVPKEYDKYLTRTYGDYMTLPPENKRKVHGFKGYWKDAI